MYNALDFT